VSLASIAQSISPERMSFFDLASTSIRMTKFPALNTLTMQEFHAMQEL
jgi:hypothetical protein